MIVSYLLPPPSGQVRRECYLTFENLVNYEDGKTIRQRHHQESEFENLVNYEDGKTKTRHSKLELYLRTL